MMGEREKWHWGEGGLARGGGALMNSGDTVISRTVVWVEERRVLNYTAFLLSASSPRVTAHSYLLGRSGRAGENVKKHC